VSGGEESGRKGAMPLALTDGQLKQAMQAASLIRRATMTSCAALPPREILRGEN